VFPYYEVIRNEMGRVIGVSLKLGPFGVAIHFAYIADLIDAGR
jgi:hypothetical protein